MSRISITAYMDFLSLGITKEDVMNILDVDEASANELLTGVISFNMHEAEEILKHKNISINDLLH